MRKKSQLSKGANGRHYTDQFTGNTPHIYKYTTQS